VGNLPVIELLELHGPRFGKQNLECNNKITVFRANRAYMKTNRLFSVLSVDVIEAAGGKRGRRNGG